MDDQRLRVADVGEVAQELRRVDEALAGLRAALDAEVEQPRRALREILLRERVILVVRQARVVHPRDARVVLQELRHRERVRAMAIHAHGQRFQALQQQPGVERRERRAEGAHDLHARLHGVAEVAEGLVEDDAVVAGRGRGELGELAVAPVELARLDDHAAHGRAVAADVLGRRVHHDVGAPLDRPAQVRRGHGVVEHQRDLAPRARFSPAPRCRRR